MGVRENKLTIVLRISCPRKKGGIKAEDDCKANSTRHDKKSLESRLRSGEKESM